jgi:hypothetical protein
VPLSGADEFLIAAADVVGPAPATPDEGEYHEVTIAKLWLELREARSEGRSRIDVIVRKDREIADLTIHAARLRDALAAAEAERDALAHEIDVKYETHDFTITDPEHGCDWCGDFEDEPIHRTSAVVIDEARRALSVEAAGPERGGSDA